MLNIATTKKVNILPQYSFCPDTLGQLVLGQLVHSLSLVLFPAGAALRACNFEKHS